MHDDGPGGKVTADHLRRGAFLYIRQSSLKQVVNNTESTRGSTRCVAGRSRWAGRGPDHGDRHRSGHLRRASTAGGRLPASGRRGLDGPGRDRARPGGVPAGAQQHRLAPAAGDLRADPDPDPGRGRPLRPADLQRPPRPWHEGTMSEAELHLLGARLRGGQLSKARRGELKQGLPIGYVYDRADRPVIDPDASVRGPVARVFALFAATGSARQVVIAFARDDLRLPASGPHRAAQRRVGVRGPEHSRVLTILHNPFFAGAFSYGSAAAGSAPTARQYYRRAAARGLGHPDRRPPRRPDTSLSPSGRRTSRRSPPTPAPASADRARGPAPGGPALLQGLLVCGPCGRGMTVGYHLQSGREVPDYRCMSQSIDGGRSASASPARASSARSPNC